MQHVLYQLATTVVEVVVVVVFRLRDRRLCFRLTGKKVQAINTGSYNYLGFAGNVGPCVEAAEEAVNKHGLACCSSRQEYGEL